MTGRLRAGRRAALVVAALTTVALAPTAIAYQFEPTDAEFNSWPPYCRARYVTTTIGQSSRFVPRIERTSISAAEGAIGSQTFVHVHHYCAGLAHFARARHEPDPQRRRFQLDEARSEMLYSLRNDPGNGPLQTTMIVNLALVERERGDLPAAHRLLEDAIRLDGKDPKPYLGLAIVQRSDGKLDQARATLERGIESAGADALELLYNLGLICLELGDADCAVRRAREVYARGYPFAGLKNRLADRGLWQE